MHEGVHPRREYRAGLASGEMGRMKRTCLKIPSGDILVPRLCT